ncbi:hypothetical protein FE257_011172 [Aspergillus nanangensis]|uniref:Uncharacterized protein n=1 Tax=Aspergillus nanangensis TaxID=2582783 RepID=A0AAD4CHN3_ASPNN|nr:hypothetical protein FE257_011172 [Aspergillus nanangensis]
MAQRQPTTHSTGLSSHIPKPRQEALRIRQALTSYLQSQIIFADDGPDHRNHHAQSHLSLCVPHDAVVDVMRIPSEVTGLRREYLEALQANVTARREYQATCEQRPPKQLQGAGVGAGTQPIEPSLELQAYLRLLRDRRRHAKLQVFQHYLQEIKTRNTAPLDDFDAREIRGEQVTPPEDLEDGIQNGGKGQDRIEELLQNLERAVIRAKVQLNREKKLLEQLKAQLPHNADQVAPAMKLAALQRTRDELVHWVEEKLVSEGDHADGPMEEIPAEEVEESARLLEDQKAQIVERYAAYVDARKRLLDAASRACQPVTIPSTKPPDRTGDLAKPVPSETTALDPAAVLSMTSEILLPLSKAQRALALQKTYLSGLLAKEKSTTLRMLNRLRDESHLLPEYPLLARQPRFKHAIAALSSRHVSNPAESSKQTDEVISLAEAWAFASQAAGTAERDYVDQKVCEGSETAEDAEQVLREVYDLLNQDLEETLREDPGEGTEENDIWTSQVQPGRMKSHRRDQRPPGPWSGLDGRVGIDE